MAATYLLAGWMALLPGAGARADAPTVGSPVPEFRMADQEGRWITSASLKGKRYVIAWYPKDFTPG